MTDFGDEPARSHGESIVPMINVVFLLLIFFLMTATLAPPDPFDVTPPSASGEESDGLMLTLHVSADGELAFEAARGEAVWPALAASEAAAEGELILRADGAAAAEAIATLLERLAATGITRVEITAVPQQ
ncbi:MAG: biopolymer transporter ExbD [Pseudomonadota bacterium]